jgi:hypothetical protein
MAGEPSSSDETPQTPDAPDTPDETNRRTRQMVAGAAIGIGSAAIVAALLYATRTKKQEKKPAPPIESD